jgi:hypothetical protein
MSPALNLLATFGPMFLQPLVFDWLRNDPPLLPVIYGRTLSPFGTSSLLQNSGDLHCPK